jgi:hypothetical protein
MIFQRRLAELAEVVQMHVARIAFPGDSDNADKWLSLIFFR